MPTVVGVVVMDQPHANDMHDSVTIIMYTFSLIDDYYHDKVMPGVSLDVQG